MSYYAPYIDEAGLHIPTYNDIKQHLIDEAKIIFGDDIYLENDSQDYEYISLLADKIHDCYMTCQLIYNNRTPPTAVGAALDGLLKLNGLRRKRMTRSKCEVVISGAYRTNIINGIIADEDILAKGQSVNWDLPELVTIGEDGTATVTAICQKYEHTVSAGRLNRIVTPTDGWVSVINYADSVEGQKFETDAEAKARQAESTANPSRTVIEGTDGAIAAIDDVTRRRVYENKTNITDFRGLPPHSISAVVEGGSDYAVAEAIYLHKTPGCNTYGDIEIDIERENLFEIDDLLPISFFRPAYKEIFVTISIKRLSGYSSSIEARIISAVSQYLNNIRIGDDLIISAIWGTVQSVNPNQTKNIFSVTEVTAGYEEDIQDRTDLEIKFNEVTLGKEENIKIIFV